MILTPEIAAKVGADAPRMYARMTRGEWSGRPEEQGREEMRPSEAASRNGLARQCHMNVWWVPV